MNAQLSNCALWCGYDGNYVIYHGSAISACTWMIPGSYIDD